MAESIFTKINGEWVSSSQCFQKINGVWTQLTADECKNILHSHLLKRKEIITVDFNYTSNSDGTYTLTEWLGTLNGEPSTLCYLPNDPRVIL